jgi:hypothetical protein
MFPWQEILQLSIRGTLAAYFEPVFWMIVGLISYQYWQIQRNQKRMFGVSVFSLGQQVLLAILLGSVGGILGSFLLTLLGINVNQLGISYIWPVAIVLMAINMRFVCFAYAGGLVALSKIFFGWPLVDVPQVLVLVAILHITESILIALSGYHGSMPIILRQEDGKLVGAFSLQNFWPLPLLLMAAIAIPEFRVPQSVLDMPEWWPLLPINLELPEGHTWMYAMIPVVAALGYTDIAVTSPPKKRRRKSALHLAVYSLILLTLSLLSVQYHWLQVVAALVSPLGHEMLIQMYSRKEMAGDPLYVHQPRGLMVLDTIFDTPADKAGVETGDILLALQGQRIDNRNQLGEAISMLPPFFEIEILRNGRIVELQARFQRGERMLGVVLVPEGNESYYVEAAEEKFWLWEKCKTLWGKKG